MNDSAMPNGVIDSGRLYTLEAFKNTLSIGKVAMQQARRKGLVVRYVGNRAFVLGSDYIRLSLIHI